jgi:hypothetical protein
MARLLPIAGRAGARKAIPWLTYYEIAKTIAVRSRGAWTALTPVERATLQRVIRDSRGRPGAVTPADRREVRRIVGRALKGAVRPS